jgi:molybdopterin molybdotransferase
MASMAWAQAVKTASSSAVLLDAETVPVVQCAGRVTAEPLLAPSDLPARDTSAMDGWAVAGPGPWHVVRGLVLAGDGAGAIARGSAVRIATGGQIPAGATAVLRSEHAALDGGVLRGDVAPRADVRPRGQECRRADVLLAAGSLVTPAVLGLAAAGGCEHLVVTRRPTVRLLVIGDELVPDPQRSSPRGRDALGPMLPDWFRAYGAEVADVVHLPDSPGEIRRAVETCEADLLVTTGGTASGPSDHVRPVLAEIGATMLVDGVAVRPGHPMLMARTATGHLLIGLPGNPLGAVSGVMTLVEPLLRAMSGRLPGDMPTRRLSEQVTAHPTDTRLAPVHGVTPLHFTGPAMLRGLATADALAVVRPGSPGREVGVLGLPW